MTAPGCPAPGRCPVPDPYPALLRRVRGVTLPAGTLLARGHAAHRPADTLTPGVGDTRFAPVAGAQHAYVARRRATALLESAFHDVNPPAPRIHQPLLARWALAEVRLRVDLRLIDLRDPQLARLGLARSSLVTVLPAHFPCTRAWAATLHGRVVGGHPTHGLVWHSRQAELHAAADPGSLTADLLAGEVTEVAVVYAPPAPVRLFTDTGRGPGPLAVGAGRRLALELANLIGAPAYPAGA